MKYKVYKFFDKDYPITQKYGERPEYYAQFGLKGHEGVDYGTPNGTPIYSPFDGVILRDTFADKSYGDFTVVWDPTQKIAMWFCHLQDVSTKTGDKVTKGQLLGHTDNTGNSSGPHCHVNFVETDATGNRLNKDNGFQGFLDLLSSADILDANQPMPTPEPVLSDDEKNSLSVLKDAFKALPDGDKYKHPAGNLEGYTRGITDEHLHPSVPTTPPSQPGTPSTHQEYIPTNPIAKFLCQIAMTIDGK